MIPVGSLNILKIYGCELVWGEAPSMEIWWHCWKQNTLVQYFSQFHLHYCTIVMWYGRISKPNTRRFYIRRESLDVQNIVLLLFLYKFLIKIFVKNKFVWSSNDKFYCTENNDQVTVWHCALLSYNGKNVEL